MATGSLMMGTLKGKLGETVALRRSGKQVLRAYVRDVKNPNSQKQQVQRMIQSTVAQAYSAMKKICDHSFEGVQVGQKSMSYFMSKNMDKLRASIVAGTDGTLVSASADFVRKGVNLPVLNKYIVAKGTLPEVAVIDNVAEPSNYINPAYELRLIDGNYASAAAGADAFVKANAGQVGDWFTFLFLLRENGAEMNGQPVYRFAFVRYLVQESADTENFDFALLPTLTNQGVVTEDPNYSIGQSAPIATDVHAITLKFSQLLNNIGVADGAFTLCAYAVIHSRQNVGGSWQRSNAEFVIRNNWEALNITWPGGFFAELATYAGSSEAKGQGDYVLNGGQ